MTTDVDYPEIPAIEWCFGAGGNHIGLRRVLPGLRLVAACEIEAYAVANMVAKMEAGLLDAAPVWTDCKTFPCELFSDRVALFIASYPCQPFSIAGHKRGHADERNLWPFVLNGFRTMRPLRGLLENVENHVSLGLSTVISDLEEAGYRCAWGIFSAEECGATQRRRRVFIMAEREDRRFGELWQSSGGDRFTNGRGKELADASDGFISEPWRRAHRRNGTGPAGACLEHAESQRARTGLCEADEKHDWPRSNGAGIALAGTSESRRQRFRSSREKESANASSTLPPYPPRPDQLDQWREVLAIDASLEPAICRMADGLAYRMDRLRLTGNGVVPDTAALAYVTLSRKLAA